MCRKNYRKSFLIIVALIFLLTACNKNTANDPQISSSKANSSTLSSNNDILSDYQQKDLVEKIFTLFHIPPEFKNPSEIPNDELIYIASLHADGTDNYPDYPDYIIPQSEIEKTAKEIFGPSIAIKHQSVEDLKYDNEKKQYSVPSFGVEEGFQNVVIDEVDTGEQIQLKIIFIYSCSNGFYDYDYGTDYDQKSFLGTDLETSAKKQSKSPIYLLTLKKNESGEYYIHSFVKE